MISSGSITPHLARNISLNSTSRGSRSCGVTTNLIQRLCRTMTRCASNHPTSHQITENKAKVPLTKRVAMLREMPRSEGGSGGAYVTPKSAKRTKEVTNDQPTIRQAGYGFQSTVFRIGSGASRIHQSTAPPKRNRQPSPNQKLGLMNPTICFA